MFDRVIDKPKTPACERRLCSQSQVRTADAGVGAGGTSNGRAPIEAFVWWDELGVFARIAGFRRRTPDTTTLATQMAERALELSRRSGWVMVETPVSGFVDLALRGERTPRRSRRSHRRSCTRSAAHPRPNNVVTLFRREQPASPVNRDASTKHTATPKSSSGRQRWYHGDEAMTLCATRESALIARDEGNVDQAQDKLETHYNASKASNT